MKSMKDLEGNIHIYDITQTVMNKKTVSLVLTPYEAIELFNLLSSAISPGGLK